MGGVQSQNTKEPAGEIPNHHSKRWTRNKITVAPSEQVGQIRVETDSDSLGDYDSRAIPGNPSNPESKVKMRSIP
jgi:hypothetical protein